MATKIQKRNGVTVAFDTQKIRNAIFKANQPISDEKMNETVLDDLTAKVRACFKDDHVPTVEQVQDAVEEKLIDED